MNLKSKGWKILKEGSSLVQHIQTLHSDLFYAQKQGRMLVYGSKIIYDNAESPTTCKVIHPTSQRLLRDPILEEEKWIPQKHKLRTIMANKRQFDRFYLKAFEPLIDDFTRFVHIPNKELLGDSILKDIGQSEVLLGEIDFPQFFCIAESVYDFRSTIRRKERILIMDDQFLSDSKDLGVLCRLAAAMKWDLIVWVYQSVHPYSFPILRSSGGGILNIPIVMVKKESLEQCLETVEDEDIELLDLTSALNDIHRVKQIENEEFDRNKEYLNSQLNEYLQSEEILDTPIRKLKLNRPKSTPINAYTQFNPEPLKFPKALYLSKPLDRPGLDPYFDLSKLDSLFQATLAISQFSQVKITDRIHDPVHQLVGYRDHLIRLSATPEATLQKLFPPDQDVKLIDG